MPTWFTTVADRLSLARPGGGSEEKLADVGVALTNGPFQAGDDVLDAGGGDAIVKVEAHGRQYVVRSQMHRADGVHAADSAALGSLALNWLADAVHHLAAGSLAESVGNWSPGSLPDRHNEEPKILERIQRGERIDRYETDRLRKDGTLVDISLTVSLVTCAAGRVVGASKIARDITEGKQAQARQELLTHEIQHRTKNLFAVVPAVASRSFVGKYTVEDAQTAVVSRLESLCQTHVMLIDKEWQGADLREIVRSEMSPYADRVHVEGPSLLLTASAAQDFALVLHELATNAAKYGALSKKRARNAEATGQPV